AASAIASGVTGTRSLRPAVSPAPVTAQVTKTSQFMVRKVNGSCTWRDAPDPMSAPATGQGGLTRRRTCAMLASGSYYAQRDHAPVRARDGPRGRPALRGRGDAAGRPPPRRDGG